MTKRLRLSIVLFALVLSAYQGLFVFQPVAIPKPSESVLWWAISSAVATCFWLFVFAPAWLPAIAPASWPRLRSALLAVCGTAQVGLGCLLALYGALLPLPNHYFAYGLLAAALGALFIHTLVSTVRARSKSISSGPPSENAASYLPPASSATSKNADVEQAGRDDAGEA